MPRKATNKDGTPRKRMGRPPHAREAFVPSRFEAMLQVGASEVMVCTALGISERSLTRLIRDHYGPEATFSGLAELHRTNITLSIRQQVLRMALGFKDQQTGRLTKSDRTLLIFAAKAFAGLSERVEVRKDAAQFAEEQATAKAATDAAARAAAVEATRVDAILAALAGDAG